MKIMFICTGNICRSAMAEAIFKYKIKNTNLESKIDVFSAGTYAEDGAFSTYTAIEAMDELGIDLKLHRATNISNSKIADMDLILCATINHKNIINTLYPNLSTRVFTIKEYAEFDIDNGLDIGDPYGYDLTTYRKCASLLDSCIDKIIFKIQEKGLNI